MEVGEVRVGKKGMQRLGTMCDGLRDSRSFSDLNVRRL